MKKTSRLKEAINQILNMFFIFYWWLFFTPQVEINSGIFVVGANSFLAKYRETLDYSEKPLWMLASSSIGLILVNFTNLIIIYCFRDFEFNGSVIAKRRFHIILIFQSMCHFLIEFCYYLNITIVVIFKHIVVHILSTTLMVDFLYNWPYHNISFAKYLLVCIGCFQV